MKKILTDSSDKNKIKQNTIRQIIYQKIINGDYGEKLPSVRELASELSVNVITLRKALSPLIADGVIYTKDRKGIFINAKKRKCIGLIGSTLKESLFNKGEYFGDVFSGIFDAIEKENDFFSYQSKQNNHNYIELLRENSSVSGVIVFAPPAPEEGELQKLAGKIPLVVIGAIEQDKTISFVDSDNYNDSVKAVRTLIKEKNKEIVFLSSKFLSTVQELRYEGYKDALKGELKYDENLVIIEDPRENSFRDRLAALFSSENPPAAVFAADNYAAIKFLEIEEIPKNKLNLIVYDDPKNVISKFGIKYRVIQQPLYEIGLTAVDMLYDLINNKNTKPEQRKLASKLINKKGINIL